MTDSERPCHAITIQFCTPDRGKISLHWFISEERARDLADELKDRIGEPDNEFIVTADVIDRATRAAFNDGGGVMQHNGGGGD